MGSGVVWGWASAWEPAQSTQQMPHLTSQWSWRLPQAGSCKAHLPLCRLQQDLMMGRPSTFLIQNLHLTFFFFLKRLLAALAAAHVPSMPHGPYEASTCSETGELGITWAMRSASITGQAGADVCRQGGPHGARLLSLNCLPTWV